MRQMLLVALLGTATLVAGCATKNFVRENVQPVQTKLDQVADQSNKQGQTLDQTRQNLDQTNTRVNAVNETATGADRRAGDAMTKANQADQKADQDAQKENTDIASVRNEVANLDNYKVSGQATVLFGFNQATLTKDDKMQLDQLAGNAANFKHYFIAVEGYTDKTGAADYNLELSKRRADAVVQYLAGQKDVDFNRIHTIGFGAQKPADEGKTSKDRAKNRRVEVKIYSSDAQLQTDAASPR